MGFDALLLLTFGGPEGPEDVLPFLRNVLRGRPVPPERIALVAEQYMQMGGRSPINDQSRSLLDALRARTGLPVYWGNRNWKPYLADTVRQMAADGVKRAAVFVPSAFASYSGCRQYLDDLDAARRAAGAHSPVLLKVPPFYEHQGFVRPLAESLREALVSAGPYASVLMSAHSIPEAAAATCDYVTQLGRAGRMVASLAGVADEKWSLVFQSRSGPPQQPWLGPDVNDAISRLDSGSKSVVVVPIGFVSDHMEVVYDLDRRAAEAAAERGIRFLRSATPAEDPRFADMVIELVERLGEPGGIQTCPSGCCPAPIR
jgi:ferrochelatase